MSERERRVAALVASQHGVVSTKQLAEVGVGSSTLARWVETGRWCRCGPGVVGPTAVPRTFHRDVMAAVLSVPGAAASHLTAAWLHRMRYLGEIVLAISVPPGANHRLPGVRVHRSIDLAPGWIGRVEGIEVTTPSRTLIDVAAVVSRARLERIVDGALADRRVTLHELVAAFNRHARRGRRGIGKLRPLLDLRADGQIAPGSELERRFLRFVRRCGLPLPCGQVPIAGFDGMIGIADFVYAEQRVIIELDGRLGHAQLVDFEHDRWRDQQAAAAGWRVVRITWRQLHERPDEVERVLRAVLDRTAG